MRGYGTVEAYDGYSRNSGCGGVCGREQSTNKAGDITAGTFRWDNGPQGFGDHCKPGTTTQWPSTLNLGSTFDPELALEWGDAMGDEFWCAIALYLLVSVSDSLSFPPTFGSHRCSRDRHKGTNIQEGPGM